MRMIVWISFEESTFSEARCRQLMNLSRYMDARIAVLTSSRLSGMASERMDAEIMIYDDFLKTIHSPSECAIQIASVVKNNEVSCLIAPHTPLYLRILSIASAALGWPFISGMMTQYLPKVCRLICAGRTVETIKLPNTSFVSTLVLDTTLENVQVNPKHEIDCQSFVGHEIHVPKLISFESFQSDLIPLDGANLVFAGGRGLGNKDHFDKLARCAKKYGAALAASRIAVDLGWCRNDIQVGQTGHAIAPEIYIAFGISGSIQHLAGIRNARKVIAINTDKNAPIFQHADYGYIGDAMHVIDRLMSE